MTPANNFADFPMTFCILCIVAEERLAERFRVRAFETCLLLGNRRNTLPSSAFFAKSHRGFTPALEYKIAWFCLVPLIGERVADWMRVEV